MAVSLNKIAQINAERIAKAKAETYQQSTMFDNENDGLMKYFNIQLWGKDDYAPKEVLLTELKMVFLTRNDAEEFANKLREHFDYTTDWCWVRVNRVA